MLYTLQTIEDQYRALQQHDIRAQKVTCNYGPATVGSVTLRAVLRDRTVRMRFVLAPGGGGFELESVR